MGRPTTQQRFDGIARAEPAVTGTQSVFRALSILAAMTPASPAIKASGVAARFGYSLPTAHRLLRTLEGEGFLVFDRGTREYRPGPEILRLSGVIIDHTDLIPRAITSLMRLRDLTGESAALHWRLGNSRSCIQEMASQHGFHVSAGVGQRYPLTRGAAGKAMLAATNDDDVRSVLADPGVIPPSAGMEVLLAELKSVRRLGYAESHSETVAGAASVAAPIDWTYRGVASISVTGPESRFGPVQRESARQALLDELGQLRYPATRRISPGSGITS